MSKVVEATLLDVDLPAEPRSASRARRAVLDALSGIAVDRDAVGVVVSGGGDERRPARVSRPGAARAACTSSASMDDDGVEVAVDDDGLGMRPRGDSPGVGLGLPLMGDLADRVEITSRGPGTRDPRASSPDGRRRPARPRRWRATSPGAPNGRPHASSPPKPAYAVGVLPRAREQVLDEPVTRRAAGALEVRDVGVEVPAAEDLELLRLARPLERVDRQVATPSGDRPRRRPSAAAWVRSTAGTCPARTPRTSRRCAACTR